MHEEEAVIELLEFLSIQVIPSFQHGPLTASRSHRIQNPS